MQSMVKEIIILGMAPSRMRCPFDAEVWSVNTGYRQVAQMGEETGKPVGHIEKIFLAHLQVPDPDDNVHIFDWNELNRLIEAGVEVFNIHRVKGLNAKLYPLKYIARKFQCNYFSNTICYMLAYALHKATIKNKTGQIRLKYPLKLRLYGIDMMEKMVEGRGEYTLEKGGVEYWLGFAQGLGVEVFISEGSEVCKTFNRVPYGKKWITKKYIDPFGLLRRKRPLSREERLALLPKIMEATRNVSSG